MDTMRERVARSQSTTLAITLMPPMSSSTVTSKDRGMEARVTKRVKDAKDTGQTGNEVRKGCALATCANHNRLLLPPSSRMKVETSSHDGPVYSFSSMQELHR